MLAEDKNRNFQLKKLSSAVSRERNSRIFDQMTEVSFNSLLPGPSISATHKPISTWTVQIQVTIVTDSKKNVQIGPPKNFEKSSLTHPSSRHAVHLHLSLSNARALSPNLSAKRPRMDDNGDRCGLMARCLVGASEYFLRQRNFDACRNYALKARESDSHSVAAAQLLAVADVLSASETRVNNIPYDWYAILGVRRYSHDSEVIRNQFKDLILLLNPSKNKFVFASHAFALVRNAWAVLSSPSRKSQFDNELKMLESENELKDHPRPRGNAGGPEFLNSTRSEEKMEEKGASSGETFWTICPYCYYVYEYLRVYEDCCLRCQNHKCRRGFHAVVIPPPPAGVAETAEYWCLGFFPLGYEGGEGKGCSSWLPFMPMNMGTPRVDVKEQRPVPKGANEDDGTQSFIEISDDSDDSNGEFGETPTNANTKIAQTVEEVQKGDQSSHGCETKMVETEAVNVAKPAIKRKKKSMAKGTKKLMGKGIRVKLNKALPSKIDGGLDLNAEACEDDDDIGHGRLVQGKDKGDGAESVSGEMEFFEGDNDIFVSLQGGF